jgi:hypothetical protein
VGEAIAETGDHWVLPFTAICSSSLASLSASSKVSIALAVFPTSMLSDAASPGVTSPSATASVSAAAAAIRYDRDQVRAREFFQVIKTQTYGYPEARKPRPPRFFPVFLTAARAEVSAEIPGWRARPAPCLGIGLGHRSPPELLTRRLVCCWAGPTTASH